VFSAFGLNKAKLNTKIIIIIFIIIIIVIIESAPYCAYNWPIVWIAI